MRTVALVVFYVAPLAVAGCLRPGEDADPRPPAAEQRAPDPSVERSRLEQEVAGLRAELATREAELQSAALGHADLSHKLEEASERDTELVERLRNATDAIERLTAERKNLADALEQLRTRGPDETVASAPSE